MLQAEDMNPKPGNNLSHLRSRWYEECLRHGRMKKYCMRTEWHKVIWERKVVVRWYKLKPMWSSLAARNNQK